jgi:hypothetical protein
MRPEDGLSARSSFRKTAGLAPSRRHAAGTAQDAPRRMEILRALGLELTVEQWQARAGLGNSPRTILEEVGRIQGTMSCSPSSRIRRGSFGFGA